MRQTCRSKHKVLVLKCYPKYQKSAVDVKPNPSELSYLLYYASTRRSKLPKVGAFLERRTISDVRRGRVWDVQITLRILKALIDKTPRDLPLYANSVLNILDMVLSSKDLTTAEDSIPTFESFCEHHDGPSLAASQDYLRQFEGVLGRYARLALDPTTVAKDNVIAPVAMRWRTVGLRAISCVTSSEMLSVDGMGQLATAMSVILENLSTQTGDGLRSLQRKAQAEQQAEEEKVMNRRMSLVTVRTGETGDAHPAPFLPTAAETDRLAQEKVVLMALNCLKGIFTTNNRGQIRTATGLVLDFILTRVPTAMERVENRPESRGGQSWATALLEMLAQWVAVQDRYIILVAAMDALVSRPVVDNDLRQQLLLASLIGSLLRSEVNLIGLSVMDVLVDLIRRLLSVLELGAGEIDTQVVLQSVQTKSSEQAIDPMATNIQQSSPPPDSKSQLVQKLRGCIGDLATHVYYSDQISDMLSTILFRIRPSPQAVIGSSTVDDGNNMGDGLATPNHGSPNVHLKPTEYFLSAPARVLALKAVTEVLQVANLNEPFSRTTTSSRNRVGMEVWEGSHWLLRDRDEHVRKAYIEGLLAWLKYEVTRQTVRSLVEERTPTTTTKPRGESKEGYSSFRSSYLKSHSILQSSKFRFLGLLHVAMYDHILEYIESSSSTEILGIHMLLYHLTDKLSIVAVKHSLPMIFRLQEEIPSIENTTAKIRLASLVHGYFWLLSERFDFESSWIGREILNEINRRRNKGLWMEGIHVPPMPTTTTTTMRVDGIPVSAGGGDASRPTLQTIVQPNDLRTFDHREEVIELIAKGWSTSIISPPGSPSSSPTRKQTMPILDSASPTTSSTLSPFSPSSISAATDGLIPQEIRVEMNSEWNREVVLASYRYRNDTASKSVSMNGSRRGMMGLQSGGGGGGRDLLAVAGMSMMNGNAVGGAGGRQSPHLQQHLHHGHGGHQISSSPVVVTGGVGGGGAGGGGGGGTTLSSPVGNTTTGMGMGMGMGSIRRLRQLSLNEANGTGNQERGSSTPISISSSRSSVVKVDDLKRVLTGGGGPSPISGVGSGGSIIGGSGGNRIAWGNSSKGGGGDSISGQERIQTNNTSGDAETRTPFWKKTQEQGLRHGISRESIAISPKTEFDPRDHHHHQFQRGIGGVMVGGNGVETMDFGAENRTQSKVEGVSASTQMDGSRDGKGNGNGISNENGDGKGGDGKGNGNGTGGEVAELITS
ncbi:MAG: hypothetical protein M1823_005084 [Watsoniomyces obsoletus]|nr:MAG: hypothetical protein M1823_005084 [Watsoniomyces obsoletus]